LFFGKDRKKYAEVGFIDRFLTYLFYLPLMPKITYTKEEKKKLGIYCEKNKKGFLYKIY